MTNQAKVVAIEEHFWSPDLQTEAMVGVPPNTRAPRPYWYTGLSDLAEHRIKEMDEARIDLQVILGMLRQAHDLPCRAVDCSGASGQRYAA